ncbi:uncharacterized protein LOC131936095 [Physella acuta]|uniref:uncharacterized protein LOC131936095 n=1 Tax=Physella acuta TaxID=109671 RepID=UPI0027DC7E03|nr:uncharacterized protein LOC131936095 [Physella acuta]
MAHRKLYLSAEVTSGDVKLSLNAESQDNTWELTQNVDVTANGLIICQTGMYYVYNSVQFRTKEYVKKQTVYFYMRQTNKQHTSHVLLRNLHTVAENLSVDRETGFSGGVFHLDEGDVIEVFVSGQGLVETGRNTTYIGLVRLVH